MAYRNCVELTHARWRSDVQLLIESLRRLIGISDEINPRSAGGKAIVADQAQPSSRELTSSPNAEQITASRFDAATLQRIRRELALHIGPIAELVLARAAPLCHSTEDLFIKVAEEIESPREREDFLRKMNSHSLLGGTTPVRREGQSPVFQSPQKPTHGADADPVHAAPPRSWARSMSSIPVMIKLGGFWCWPWYCKPPSGGRRLALLLHLRHPLVRYNKAANQLLRQKVCTQAISLPQDPIRPPRVLAGVPGQTGSVCPRKSPKVFSLPRWCLFTRCWHGKLVFRVQWF